MTGCNSVKPDGVGNDAGLTKGIEVHKSPIAVWKYNLNSTGIGFADDIGWIKIDTEARATGNAQVICNNAIALDVANAEQPTLIAVLIIGGPGDNGLIICQYFNNEAFAVALTGNSRCRTLDY